MISRAVLSLVLVLLVGVAGVTTAATPDPAMCIVDPVITGSDTGIGLNTTPGGCGLYYQVVLRDANGDPCKQLEVVLDFTAAPNIVIQCPQNLGTSASCGSRTISTLTNDMGVAAFRPRIGGFENNPLVAVRVPSAGLTLAMVPARSTDINGEGGTGLPDLSLFRARFFNDVYDAEIDFDCIGPIEQLPDLAIFRVPYFADDVTNYCPQSGCP